MLSSEKHADVTFSVEGQLIRAHRCVLCARSEYFETMLGSQFREGESRESLGLDGTETFDISLNDKLEPRQAVEVTARKPNGEVIHFVTTCRIDTPVEVVYYRNGGILHTVLRQLARG
jgi:aconitase A